MSADDPTTRPVNPQACVLEGGKIGVFVGSAYRYLTAKEAFQLCISLSEAVETLAKEIAADAAKSRAHLEVLSRQYREQIIRMGGGEG